MPAWRPVCTSESPITCCVMSVQGPGWKVEGVGCWVSGLETYQPYHLPPFVWGSRKSFQENHAWLAPRLHQREPYHLSPFVLRQSGS